MCPQVMMSHSPHTQHYVSAKKIHSNNLRTKAPATRIDLPNVEKSDTILFPLFAGMGIK